MDGDVVFRITPARAGKTDLDIYAGERDKDHPRACGENMRAGLHLIGGMGSPPRVRGKQILIYIMCADVRITPARAGKTLDGIGRRIAPEDHPRACGEN